MAIKHKSSGLRKKELKNFIKVFEFKLECIVNKSSFLTAVLSNFNGRLKDWYKNDKTTSEGCKIDATTSQSGSQKIIKEPI